MKYIKRFNESITEQIPVEELLNDLKDSDEEFKETAETESDKYALSIFLGYSVNDFMPSFPEGNIFKFIKAYSEKGDGKDEETIYGIFQRKSDGKFFRVFVHDAGFIGPTTLTMSNTLEEIIDYK